MTLADGAAAAQVVTGAVALVLTVWAILTSRQANKLVETTTLREREVASLFQLLEHFSQVRQGYLLLLTLRDNRVEEIRRWLIGKDRTSEMVWLHDRIFGPLPSLEDAWRELGANEQDFAMKDQLPSDLDQRTQIMAQTSYDTAYNRLRDCIVSELKRLRTPDRAS